MHTLVAMATQVAHAEVPVLITGPNGAGKEVLADIVQANSAVRDRPVLQGEPRRAAQRAHRGGAVRHRGRRVHRRARARRAASRRPTAARCSSMSSATLAGSGQAKLLRVLQTGEFERLGSNTTRRTRVRVIAATNTPTCAQAIRDGTLPRGPVLPPERHRAAKCRRSPSAARTSCRWRAHFLEPGFSSRRRRRARAGSATPGPATCASCRTRSAAPACCATDHRWTRPRSTCRRPHGRAPRSRSSTAPPVEQALARARRRGRPRRA